MSKNSRFFSELWIEISVFSVIWVSLFSCFSAMRVGSYSAPVIIALWTAYRVRRQKKIDGFDFPKIGPIPWIVFFLLLISFLSVPHCFLDSYSYRFPQMLFWLQKGRPWSVPNVDLRINQMPHVWPFLSSVFFAVAHERGVAFINLISFVVLSFLIYDLSVDRIGRGEKAAAVTIALMCSHLAVMQAATNDNVITCVTYLAISAAFAMEKKATFRSVAVSALAFALCCGIKPQYLTLAPIWIFWFFFSQQKPYVQLGIRGFCLIAPIVVLCSPLLTLLYNFLVYGSFLTPDVVNAANTAQIHELVQTTVSHAAEPEIYSKPAAIFHSFLSLITQLWAPPVNPFFKSINNYFGSLPKDGWFFSLFFSKNVRCIPMQIPECASFGFLCSLMIFIGIVYSIIRKKLEYSLLAIFSMIAMTASLILTTPGTPGRSFAGFFVLLFPMAFRGLYFCSGRFVKAVCALSFLSGVFLIIFNPAAPLWPANFVASHISNEPIRQAINAYSLYSMRQTGPGNLAAMIPNSEKNIGIMVQADEPIGRLWTPYSLRRHVIPLCINTTKKELDEADVRFVVVKNSDVINSVTGMPDKAFLERTGLRVIGFNENISHMQKGAEKWFLCAVSR